MSTLRHYNVGELVVIDDDALRTMSNDNRARCAGRSWLSDEYLAIATKIWEAKAIGVVTRVFRPGYDFNVEFSMGDYTQTMHSRPGFVNDAQQYAYVFRRICASTANEPLTQEEFGKATTILGQYVELSDPSLKSDLALTRNLYEIEQIEAESYRDNDARCIYVRRLSERSEEPDELAEIVARAFNPRFSVKEDKVGTMILRDELCDLEKYTQSKQEAIDHGKSNMDEAAMMATAECLNTHRRFKVEVTVTNDEGAETLRTFLVQLKALYAGDERIGTAVEQARATAASLVKEIITTDYPDAEFMMSSCEISLFTGREFSGRDYSSPDNATRGAWDTKVGDQEGPFEFIKEI